MQWKLARAVRKLKGGSARRSRPKRWAWGTPNRGPSYDPGGAAAAATDVAPTPMLRQRPRTTSPQTRAFVSPQLGRGLMAHCDVHPQCRARTTRPSMLYKASAASFSNSKVTKANPLLASFVWPAKSRGYSRFHRVAERLKACNVSSVASSLRPPT